VFQIIQDSLYLSRVNIHDNFVILKANLNQRYAKLSHRNVSEKYEVQRMAAAAAGKNVTVLFDVWRRESNVDILKT
jgi:hypothetical protein